MTEQSNLKKQSQTRSAVLRYYQLLADSQTDGQTDMLL